RQFDIADVRIPSATVLLPLRIQYPTRISNSTLTATRCVPRDRPEGVDRRPPSAGIGSSTGDSTVVRPCRSVQHPGKSRVMQFQRTRMGRRLGTRVTRSPTRACAAVTCAFFLGGCVTTKVLRAQDSCDLIHLPNQHLGG